MGGSLATVFADDVGEDGTVGVGDGCGGWGLVWVGVMLMPIGGSEGRS